MLTRYSPSRCCCAKPDPDDTCPCFSGTFDATRSIVVTDFAPKSELFADINGTFGSLDTITSECKYKGQATHGGDGILPGTATYQLQFTRLTTIQPIGFAGTINLPAGVKAVLSVNQLIPPPITSVKSTAVFSKVIADVDGYADCSDAITGLALVGEFHTTGLGNNGAFWPGLVSYE